MTISTTATTVTYSGNGATTVFAFNFYVPAANNLVVTTTTGSTTTTISPSLYTVSGIGNAAGGNITYNPSGTPLASGSTITITRTLPLVQQSSLVSLVGYYPATVESALDYLMMVTQQLSTQINSSTSQLLNTSVPNNTFLGNNSGSAAVPTTLTASQALVALGLQVATIAALRAISVSTMSANQPALVQGYYAAGDGGGGPPRYFATGAAPGTYVDNGGNIIVPTGGNGSQAWLMTDSTVLNVKAFGAKGDFTADDTAAIQAAINALPATSGKIIFPPGRYLVSTITFPNTRYKIECGGAFISGNASVATNCIVRFKGQSCTVDALTIYGNLNANYTCALWWYDGANACQRNVFYNLFIDSALRGVVYGELPGNTDTNLPMSENSIIGYSTRSCQNPLYVNAIQGFLDVDAPNLVAEKGDWTGDGVSSGSYRYATANCFESVAGYLNLIGGEAVKTDTKLGFTANLAKTKIIGTHFECAAPIKVSGDRNDLSAARIYNTVDDQDLFSFTAAGGRLSLDDCDIFRTAGAGAGSSNYVVNASSATAPDIRISNCNIAEFGTGSVGGAGLVSIADQRNLHYSNTKLQKTAADTDLWMLETGKANLIDGRAIDNSGWQTTGWYAAAGVLALAADAPSGENYTNSVACTTTNIIVTNVDETSTTTIKNTAFICRPNELYEIEGWCRSTGAGTATISARAFTTAAAFLSNNSVYAATSTWTYFRGFFKAPATCGYFGIGGFASSVEVRFIGLKVRRAMWKE